MRTPTFQKYPRNEHDQLDATKLKPHTRTLAEQELKIIVKRAIEDANKKSSHVLLNIPDGASELEIFNEYKKAGKKLYDFFKKHCNDPAEKAYQCQGKHYQDLAQETWKVYMAEQETITAALRNRLIEKTLTRNGYRAECIEIAKTVLDELNQSHVDQPRNTGAPKALISAFGNCCRKEGLLNSEGVFDNPYKIVRALCSI